MVIAMNTNNQLANTKGYPCPPRFNHNPSTYPLICKKSQRLPDPHGLLNDAKKIF